MTRESQPLTSLPPGQEDLVLLRPEASDLIVEDEKRRLQYSHTLMRLQLLWKHREFLLRAIILGLAASLLVAFLIPSRYRSTARLMPPDDQGGSGLAMAAAALSGRSGGLGSMASDILGLKSTSDIFVGILNSRTTEDKLIQQFNLKKVYRARKMEDARESLAAYTDISVDRKSQIITIDVTDRDPQRAADMCQAYVGELNSLVNELSTSSARRERFFLEGRLQSVSRDLENAERSFSQFASKNTAIDVPAQGKAMVEAAAVLQGQLIAAQSELEGLKQIYSDNNVRVRSGAARVAELRTQLEKLGGKDETMADGSGHGSESMYPSIRQLPLLGVTYADLYRQTKVQEAVFETLTQEYELAKVQEAKEIPTVKVLDPSDVPDKKSFPPRLLIIFLGTALALSTAATWIFVNGAWEATDSNNPTKLFAKEVFSTVKARLPWGPSNSAVRETSNGKFLGNFVDDDNHHEIER